jgi:hypothetical protein
MISVQQFFANTRGHVDADAESEKALFDKVAYCLTK